MNETAKMTAQIVMRRADGHSILDLGPVTAEAANRTMGDLPPDRVADIQKRLSGLGLTVLSGNANTLSVSGPSTLFQSLFGLEGTSEKGATKIPGELAPYVADVFLPPKPELFP